MAETDIQDARPIVTRAEAKAAGLNRYFTGKPCSSGHVAERQVCGTCVECHKASGLIYRVNHPETKSAANAHWYAKNVDRIRVRSALWYMQNAIRHCERGYIWRAANKDRVRELGVRWRRENSIHVKRVYALWRARNPGRVLARNATRRARNKGALGVFTAADIANILKKQKRKCAYCRVSLASGYHIDHITPLSLGGSNWPKNLQLTCAPCNLSKGAKNPVDFAQRHGMLL